MVINNLNSEIMINKIIVENFNWKYLDYINYTNYKNAIDKIELNNEKLDNFLNSKMFIEQTTTLTNYLFNKNIPTNDIERKNNNKKNIFSIINNNNFHEEEKDDIFINNMNNDIYNINNNDNEEIIYINILDILTNGNAVLCNKNNIYTYFSDRNELKKIEEEKNDKNKSLYSNDNDIDKNNKKICKSLFNLQKNISLKIDDYNILIWKMEKEKELKKEKLFNFINNYKNNDVINKPNENLLSEENKVENKEQEQEKEKEDQHDKQNEIKNIEDKNLIKNNEIKAEEKEKEKENNINNNIFNPFTNIFSNNFNNSKENNENENIGIKEEEKKEQKEKKEEKENNKSNNLFSSSLFNNNINNNNENIENSERVNLAISYSNNDTEKNHDTSGLCLINNNNNNNTNINNNISLFTNNNRAGVSLFDQTNDYTYNNYTYNNLFSNSINYNREIHKQEREREVEYVYISATGHKYHGRSQCGRMKSSRRVPITTAEAMGLGPCMKCY